MKAAVYDVTGGPEVLQVKDIPDPRPEQGQLLVRVEAISVEGGDILGRQRREPPGPNFVLGYAAAGEIVAMADDVVGFAVGQKVATFEFAGSYAELRAVTAANCWVVPEGLDIKVAAAIPCGPGTAALALQLADFGSQPGQTVLVTGAAGGVGSAAVQIAAHAGARVIGTGSNRETLDSLRQLGLSDGIVTQDQHVSEKVFALLGERPIDILIDNVGGPLLSDALKTLKDGGKAILVGAYGGRNETINSTFLMLHRLMIAGCFLGPVISQEANRASIANLLEMARKGELKVPIDAVFPLSEVSAAHARAEERGRIGRVIITP